MRSQTKSYPQLLPRMSDSHGLLIACVGPRPLLIQEEHVPLQHGRACGSKHHGPLPADVLSFVIGTEELGPEFLLEYRKPICSDNEQGHRYCDAAVKVGN
jgi:hypothetical protein